MTFGATYTYTSSQRAAGLLQTPYGHLKSFNTLNLNLNWNRVAGSPIDLSVFATNVTNEHYRVAIPGIYYSSGIDFARYGEQRIIGGKARFNF